MRLTPYPRYKPSGVPWLGHVPEHWHPRRLKRAARSWISNVDKVPADDELPVRLCNYTDVYYNERIRPDMGLMETTATADEIQRFGLKVGDVIITKDSEEWSDIAVPSLVAETADDLVCGYHLAISRPNAEALVGNYLLRAFQSCAVNQQFQIAASGVTRYGLPKSAVGDAMLPFPPVDEQRAIADFLDRETAKLDTLVEKKQELVKKLKEKRTALVSHTVTRGLNPNIKFKPSGIEWLGDIPNHWELKRLKFDLFRIEQGWSPQCDNAPAEDDEWGVLKAGAVNGSTFDPLENKRLPDVELPLPQFEIKSGDLLISRANTRELLGSAALVRNVRAKLLLCDKLYRLKLRRLHFDSEFVLRFLRSVPGHFEFERDATGSSASMQNIGQGSVRNLWITKPPLPEQRVIADYLDRETAKLDRMMEKVGAAIEKLREYRIALITAAVTGRIDVRGTVKPAVSTPSRAGSTMPA